MYYKIGIAAGLLAAGCVGYVIGNNNKNSEADAGEKKQHEEKAKKAIKDKTIYEFYVTHLKTLKQWGEVEDYVKACFAWVFYRASIEQVEIDPDEMRNIEEFILGECSMVIPENLRTEILRLKNTPLNYYTAMLYSGDKQIDFVALNSLFDDIEIA